METFSVSSHSPLTVNLQVISLPPFEPKGIAVEDEESSVNKFSESSNSENPVFGSYSNDKPPKSDVNLSLAEDSEEPVEGNTSWVVFIS